MSFYTSYSDEIEEQDHIPSSESFHTKFKSLMEESPALTKKLLLYLSPIDRELTIRYFLHDINQKTLSKMYGVSQPAISRRLMNVFKKIREFIRIQYESDVPTVRRELAQILPSALQEVGVFLYVLMPFDRIATLMSVAPSTIAEWARQVQEHITQLPEDNVLRQKYLPLFLDRRKFLFTDLKKVGL